MKKKQNKVSDYEVPIKILLSVVKNNQLGTVKLDTKRKSAIASACRIAKDAADKKKTYFWNVSIELPGIVSDSDIDHLNKTLPGTLVVATGNLRFWSHKGMPFWRVVASELRAHETGKLIYTSVVQSTDRQTT